MTAGQYDRAAKEFLASADAPGAQQGLATMAHLYAARLLDLAGKRNDALTQYRAVLARPECLRCARSGADRIEGSV